VTQQELSHGGGVKITLINQRSKKASPKTHPDQALRKSFFVVISLVPWWTRADELNTAKLNVPGSFSGTGLGYYKMAHVALNNLYLQSQVAACSLHILNGS